MFASFSFLTRPLPALAGLVFIAPGALRAAEVPALKFPAEQAAWNAIAERFTGAPVVKTSNAKTLELAVTGLKTNAKGGGTASITIDPASGHVVEITSNEAKFTDEEIARFAAFPELRAVTLWHNSGSSFTGTGLAQLKGLPKLTRVTLAGGSFDDAGMAEAAKLPALRELRVWHAKFSDAGIAALRQHPTLESIKMGASWEPLLTNQSLASLATCPQLKKIGLAESWLTWKDGLEHLAAKKGQLTEIDLGNCLIAAAEVERLRAALPGTKIIWEGPHLAGSDLKKPWLRSRAEKWIPKDLIELAVSGAKP